MKANWAGATPGIRRFAGRFTSAITSCRSCRDIPRPGTRGISVASGAGPAGHRAVLAIPFAAPAGDVSAEKLADAAFAQTYGRPSVSHRGQVGLDKDSVDSNEPSAALALARSSHSTYVLYGAVGSGEAAQVLSVTVAKVKDGSAVWTRSYPLVGADPAKMAEDIDSKVPLSPPEDD